MADILGYGVIMVSQSLKADILGYDVSMVSLSLSETY